MSRITPREARLCADRDERHQRFDAHTGKPTLGVGFSYCSQRAWDCSIERLVAWTVKAVVSEMVSEQHARGFLQTRKCSEVKCAC